MDAQQAKVKLETKIQENLSHSRAVVERVMTQFPKDSIVRAQALSFRSGGAIEMHAGGQGYYLHPHALRQVADRVGVPTQYADKLEAGEGWQREMLAEVFNRSYANAPGNQKHLVRAVPMVASDGGLLEARGFLSDKFRRLDSRPIFDAFIGVAKEAGALPYHGTATDVRCALKMIIPAVRTLGLAQEEGGGSIHSAPYNEYVAFGCEISNSDYGAGTLTVRSFIMRLVCLNGATAEDAMRQVHLGGRLHEDLELSQRTYDLDTKTMVSAVKDVVRGALGPKKIDSLVERINQANAQEVNWQSLKGRLAKALTKDELRRTEESFTGPDVENLPPGNTLWRASNAISWILQSTESADRRLELEKLAGGLLDGKVVVDAVAA